MLLAFTPAPPAPANNYCLVDAWYNADCPAQFIFPNWKLTYQGSFTLLLDINTTVSWVPAPEELTGLTICNFGTAVGGTDISAVYARFYCNTKSGTDTGTLTLTYAGVYNEDTGPLPAWTWAAGSAIDWSGCPDACGTTLPCGAGITMYLYADIASCPTPNASVMMGLPSNDTLNPVPPALFDGSLTDNQDCALPWGVGDINRGADEDTIVWAYKQGPDTAAPGDTLNYTLFWGMPGTSPLTSIVLTDTMPPYTHYVSGGAAPYVPTPGWDPNPGPPSVLQWTLPGGATAGGPTGSLTYQLTVDWGNGEVFEPGSGDVAAPEGSALLNVGQFSFNGSTCSPPATVTGASRTVIRRFLFWKTGDNDVLFASSLGQPPDQMTYSIYMKNLSFTKTWWNVYVWDTVPNEIDVWCPGCGIYDPCVGWTMTPTGCAAASPGVVITGAKTTLLTWKLDMPPQYTLQLQYFGQVKATVPVGATAINQAMIKGLGQTGIIGGTGDTGPPRLFTHLAQIILRTTYVSYVGFAAGGDSRQCPGFYIDFFPLNKQTQFELRGIQYNGLAWSNNGGVSDPIGCFIGDCINGFPGSAVCTLGSGAIPGGGIPGCKTERIPATYDPTYWQTAGCKAWVYNINFIYKITSNSPVTWQLLTHQSNCNQDRHTYAPSVNLSYTGFTLYTWRGDFADGSDFAFINTDQDPYGNDIASGTTVHLFKFDYTQNLWVYQYTYDLDVESEAAYMTPCAGPNTQPCPDTAPWRFISGSTKLIVHVGEYAFNTAGCCCCSGADNHGAFAPERETGYTVGNGNFYGIDEPQGCGSKNSLVIVMTEGAAATYNIWKYTPITNIGNPKVPPLLRGTSGTWAVWNGQSIGANNTVPPVTYNAVTPNAVLDYRGGPPFSRGGSNLFKVQWTGGGNIQVQHGTDNDAFWAGGAVFHASSGQPAGSQYWISQTNGSGAAGILVAQFFHPKTGVAIRATSNNGYSATYTTNNTDECIAFLNFTHPGTAGVMQTLRFDVVTGQSALGQYQNSCITEKGFTAPFLASGEHYTIIAPPVVYIGQQFWITIQVVTGLGGIDPTYTGTSSFTSTDPAAKIETQPMDAYNYTWTGADAGSRIFYNVTFTKIGIQTIIAVDTVDGSITGITAIMVVGADVKLNKYPPLSIAASGDTVQFKICWSNYSSASAFTFVITDAVPQGTSYLPEVMSAMECGDTDGVGYSVGYSTVLSGTMPASFTTLLPGSAPPAGTSWLRWTFGDAGVQTTGCACYRVVVN